MTYLGLDDESEEKDGGGESAQEVDKAGGTVKRGGNGQQVEHSPQTLAHCQVAQAVSVVTEGRGVTSTAT